MKLVLLVVGALVIIGIFALRSWLVAGTQHLAEMEKVYKPDPRNWKLIDVAGWKQDEIEKILTDFRGMYQIPESSFLVSKLGEGQFRLTFPDDVTPPKFLFLVNYIRYPKDLNLQNRRIGVLGRARIGRAFGASDASLEGQEATVYVPANDTEFDNVYVQINSGRTFKIPFTRFIWESVDNARIPEEVVALQKR
ncbi:MAG: hypothetical protein PSV13_03255 [Lacunisphaera sp.]|nr:hypothetical protein [Lacunisphaera sp.]